MKASKTITTALNRVLMNELTAINQYFLHARIFGNWGFERLNEYRYKQSIRVMKEADKLVERILFLEDLPNLQNLGKLRIGENAVECLESDLQFERDVHRPVLIEVIALCETEKDYASRDLLEDFLEESEEAIDWLETQLSLIQQLNLPNYLQTQIKD